MAIDYEYLSRIEPHCQQSFDRLVEMAERGEELPIVPDQDWLSLRQAADLLHCHYEHLTSLVKRSRIRQRSRSMVKEDARRGCGVLVYRRDLAMLALIRQRCRLGLAASVRVFDWLREDDRI